MENLLFLGVPILKHLKVCLSFLYVGQGSVRPVSPLADRSCFLTAEKYANRLKHGVDPGQAVAFIYYANIMLNY